MPHMRIFDLRVSVHRFEKVASLLCAGMSPIRASTLKAALARSVESIRKSGYGETNPANTVGYEYGVILYTLARLLPAADLPAYRDLLDELLADRVEGAVWTEYYRGGKPSPAACPYRPWESAINLCGILAYLNEME